MNVDRLERQLPEILLELSLPRVPDYFDDALREVARTPQRPRWTFPERWISMDITAQVPIGSRLVPIRMIGLIAVLLLALLAAALLVGSQQVRPAPLFGPAGNGLVIVSRAGDIYVAQPALDREQVLIGGPEEDIAARFSRDGRTIFFGRVTSEGTLVMAANADGTNVRRVSATPLQQNDGVEVSPDGTQLLVVNTSGPRATIEVHPLDGTSRPRTLDLGDITPHGYARWRPGAGEIVFAGVRSAASLRGAFTIRPDGTGLRTIFELPDEDGFLNGPAMSEDGRWLAFWNNLDTDGIPGRSCNQHVVDLTSGVDRRLVFDPSAECEGAAEFLGNDRLVLERSDLVGIQASNSQLLVGPVDGSAAGRPIGPSWDPALHLWWELSPDRSNVLLVANPGLSSLVSIADGTARRLSIGIGDFVSWQRRPLEP
jgi:hypothetical protein